MAAISMRKIRFPSVNVFIPNWRICITSLWAKPPSGPMNKAIFLQGCLSGEIGIISARLQFCSAS